MGIDKDYDTGKELEVVGRCLYTYNRIKFSDTSITSIGLYYKVPDNTRLLEDTICGRLNRRGLLCS